MDRLSEEVMPSQAANEQAVAAVLEAGPAGGPREEQVVEDGFLPAKLLNNAAALHLRGGERAAALELMYEAVEVRRPGAKLNYIALQYAHTHGTVCRFWLLRPCKVARKLPG